MDVKKTKKFKENCPEITMSMTGKLLRAIVLKVCCALGIPDRPLLELSGGITTVTLTPT